MMAMVKLNMDHSEFDPRFIFIFDVAETDWVENAIYVGLNLLSGYRRLPNQKQGKHYGCIENAIQPIGIQFGQLRDRI